MPSLVKNRPFKASRLSQWGNSLGLRIPQEGVDQLDLKAGQTVEVEVGADRITIRPAKKRAKYDEAQLLKGMTPNRCGPELIPDTVGRERL